MRVLSQRFARRLAVVTVLAASALTAGCSDSVSVGAAAAGHGKLAVPGLPSGSGGSGSSQGSGPPSGDSSGGDSSGGGSQGRPGGPSGGPSDGASAGAGNGYGITDAPCNDVITTIQQSGQAISQDTTPAQLDTTYDAGISRIQRDAAAETDPSAKKAILAIAQYEGEAKQDVDNGTRPPDSGDIGNQLIQACGGRQ